MKKIIITFFAVFALQGCELIGQHEIFPIMPTKPELPSLQETPDGGIKLDKRDAAELFEYILDLERGYDQ